MLYNFANMKALKIIFCIVISAFTVELYADETTILINKAGIDTRSLSSTPYAKINDIGVLSISFDDFAIYSLYIRNSLNKVVYTATLPADGIEHYYDLSDIGCGLFHLTIKNSDGKYEGFFEIY